MNPPTAQLIRTVAQQAGAETHTRRHVAEVIIGYRSARGQLYTLSLPDAATLIVILDPEEPQPCTPQP